MPAAGDKHASALLGAELEHRARVHACRRPASHFRTMSGPGSRSCAWLRLRGAGKTADAGSGLLAERPHFGLVRRVLYGLPSTATAPDRGPRCQRLYLTGPGQPVDYNPSDGIDHAALLVNPQATLSLTKTASNTNPAVDDEVEYTLTASNAGPNDGTGVTIVDPLPAGLDFIDATPGCDNENGTVTCDVGTVPAGGSASVTIRTHTTAATAGMTLANLATATGDDVPSPATAGATITVQPLVDRALTKMASNPTPAADGPVSYTLTLSNNGPSPATGVTITDPLPSGLTFVSATPSQGICNTSGQTVTCNLGTLAAGGTAVVSITADVAASAAGATLQNTATASANEPIAQPELLSSKAIVNPIAAPVTEADLDVTETVNHTHAPFGTELTLARWRKAGPRDRCALGLGGR
jgi:uncharacterized repeat protein (TIGR01451 family)